MDVPASVSDDEPTDEEIARDIAAHKAWVAAGRPEAELHEKVRAELLREMAKSRPGAGSARNQRNHPRPC